MQLKEKRPETLAGLFVFVGILVLALLIVQFGKLEEKFSNNYHVYVEFSDASGLIKGSVVRMGGAKIGHVTQVPELTDKLTVRVDLAIDSRVPIYRGSEFQIQSLSFLGDKMIVVVPPRNRSVKERLNDGDMAQGVQNEGLLGLQADASNVARDAQRLMTKMDDTLVEVDMMLNDFRVTLDRINNGILSEENVESFSGSLKNIETTSERFARASDDIEKGLKELPDTIKAVKDVALSGEDTFQSLQQKMDKVDPILEELPGTLKSYRQLAVKLSALTESANQSVSAMRRGDGLLGTLMHDKEVSADTKAFIHNLKKHGLLGYKDDEGSADASAAKDSRYRGLRRQ